VVKAAVVASPSPVEAPKAAPTPVAAPKKKCVRETDIDFDRWFLVERNARKATEADCEFACNSKDSARHAWCVDFEFIALSPGAGTRRFTSTCKFFDAGRRRRRRCQLDPARGRELSEARPCRAASPVSPGGRLARPGCIAGPREGVCEAVEGALLARDRHRLRSLVPQ
jgi:hypothetical protein